MITHDEWPREYLEFVRLFNERDYFEAHEVLEDLWVVEVGELKEFYKGLIMAAVAICHWERGRPGAALRLHELGMARLRRVPADFEGLDVQTLRTALDSLFADLIADRETRWIDAFETRVPMLELRTPTQHGR